MHSIYCANQSYIFWARIFFTLQSFEFARVSDITDSWLIAITIPQFLQSVSGQMCQRVPYTITFIWPLSFINDSQSLCKWCVCAFRITGISLKLSWWLTSVYLLVCPNITCVSGQRGWISGKLVAIIPQWLVLVSLSSFRHQSVEHLEQRTAAVSLVWISESPLIMTRAHSCPYTHTLIIRHQHQPIPTTLTSGMLSLTIFFFLDELTWVSFRPNDSMSVLLSLSPTISFLAIRQ